MKTVQFALIGLLSLAASAVSAADYAIDSKGMHASVQFKISHLGYSWLYGRFNDFSGSFSYDKEKPEASKIDVILDTATVDTNHAERDKHIRSADFFDVAKYPTASFTSTSFKSTGANTAVVTGDLTFHGVTKPVSIDVTKVGEGKDPWGGYRVGFEGTTSIAMKDYGIDYNLGPASANVELILNIEGIKK